ncbi:MAG: DUF4167 domain-containing protein [Devosiaceae bacterium]|nr:DUF4167 domain-containing protein [Devosiaceae bacterium MH13]
MRPGQSNKRSRGRGRKGPSPLSRSYESNGPEVKIRGTAQHIADKYINLARDAQSSGDTVQAEAFYQHAEHYYRIVAAAQAQMNQPINVRRADDPVDTSEGDEEEERSEGFDPSDPDAPQPDMRAGNGAGPNGRDRGERGDRADRGDEDGERRSRRNRGRGRRNRDEGGRDETRRDEGEVQAASEGQTAPANGDASGEADAPANEERAPRQRKANVDVSDKFAGDAGSDAPSDASSDTPSDAPVQPASNGAADAPTLQAQPASDDT